MPPNALNDYIRTTLASSHSLLPALSLISVSKKKLDETFTSDLTAHRLGKIRQAIHAPDWIHGILQQREMVTWCACWFLCNVVITFYNKHILSDMQISPTTNTFMHMLCTFIGCLIVQKGQFPKLATSEFLRILLYSFIFAVNISWFQFSVKLTSLSLNQVSRTMSPLFQALFSYFIVGTDFSAYILTPLLCLCIGPAITFESELNLTFNGFLVCITSIIVSALKGALSMKILRDLQSKLDEYSLLVVVAPLASLWMIVFKAVIRGIYSDQQLSLQSPSFYFSYLDYSSLLWVTIGGCMAFAINTTSIGCVRRTSATSLGVMAQGKQALIILSSMFIAERDWTWNKLVGVLITLAVAAWYAYRKETERMRKLREKIIC
mmetsp:Transcript_69875/g.111115  ORF Transcript_69875/g.111115 Transcript_69875/m.111115 type:complete len:378 (+) Transcript_69875:38-1171(+)|eukprot:CAMPEP_0197026856 /NCGR_PEP_ID=MMETSP1384-20130603/6862_1 /TAXON_ID=29189 /ORGANISM="Ammonia sp." /LENGTH=377 /DNA_ID=CAMNT_0042455607 /DNA_START=71 /DNA_END=1204 /DNA_ORIENTATION=-